MVKLFLSAVLAATFLYAEDYKAEAGSAPPAELSDSVKALLEKQGTKIVKDGKTIGEVWFRAEAPASKPTTEANLSMPGIPHGSLMGAFRLDQTYSDRRGQTLKAGLYTMRYSYYPENGDHQGAAPQRDFLLLSLASEDKDGAALPEFRPLAEASKKVSGTPHPAVFSIWKEDPSYFKEGTLSKSGEHDMVLQKKIGSIPVSMIIVGKAEG